MAFATWGLLSGWHTFRIDQTEPECSIQRPSHSALRTESMSLNMPLTPTRIGSCW